MVFLKKKNNKKNPLYILFYIGAILAICKCIYVANKEKINNFLINTVNQTAYNIAKNLIMENSSYAFAAIDKEDYDTRHNSNSDDIAKNYGTADDDYEYNDYINNNNINNDNINNGINNNINSNNYTDNSISDKDYIDYESAALNENIKYTDNKNNNKNKTDESDNSESNKDTSSENEEKYIEIVVLNENIEKVSEDYVMTGGSNVLKGRSTYDIIKEEFSVEQLENFNYLLSNYYIVDSSTKAVPSVFNAKELLNMDLSIKKTTNNDVEILIYHTHASETYADSREGMWEDTVVGPGEYLTKLLEEKGYNVYHDKTAYDKKDGKDNRNYAYSTARPSIEKFLENNKSVKVIIDLHRDSGAKRAVEINGKMTSQIMLFNGLCRNQDGPINDLVNPNITTNLAFSLQTNLIGRSLYPGLMYKIYLKNYRYNQHFCGRYLLIELGTNKNTVEEAYNAMPYLAEILDTVLTGEN